jgi:UDP-glucose 4-epimerase
MHIAITGGAGRLGRALLSLLLSQGQTVHSVDRVPFPNLPQGATHTTLDMRDYHAVLEASRGCDAVVHLAALLSPHQAPEPEVYVLNTVTSYHVLAACAAHGIKRVCLASSVNAIGGVYSRAPCYDYFPVNEQHPTYAEDSYSLSKWVLEQQCDAFARRYEDMRIASLRFHGLVPPAPAPEFVNLAQADNAYKHLWGYTHLAAAARSCERAIMSDFNGHEVFYIIAPQTSSPTPSLELARQYFPRAEIRGDLSGHNGFFDCRKAERLLNWKHDE